MWNSKANVTIYGIMLALTIIVLALALAPVVRDFTESARNESSGDTIGMNCSTTTDDFVKAGCIATDLSLFYLIGGLLVIAGVVITSRIIFS